MKSFKCIIFETVMYHRYTIFVNQRLPKIYNRQSQSKASCKEQQDSDLLSILLAFIMIIKISDL